MQDNFYEEAHEYFRNTVNGNNDDLDEAAKKWKDGVEKIVRSADRNVALKIFAISGLTLAGIMAILCAGEKEAISEFLETVRQLAKNNQ